MAWTKKPPDIEGVYLVAQRSGKVRVAQIHKFNGKTFVAADGVGSFAPHHEIAGWFWWDQPLVIEPLPVEVARAT